ncbi:glycosyltransferase 87 family protein [Raineyella fluvialis]|uniref:glycosyltransferase 87 family protein n=1 Tax=Raineyella fluvialis TaxID=2662261 RepID=UPI001EF056B8|nr:glycosyltransferase 87 family protein [Raineyella fluvialis]
MFWLLLLATRQKRAAIVAPLSGIGTILLGFLVLPHSSVTYWTHTIFDSGRIGTPSYLSNQSYTGALSRLLGDGHTSVAWAVLALVTIVVGIGGSAVRWRQGHVAEAMLGTELVAILVSPVSWIHHLVWAWPILLLLVTAARTDIAARVIGSLWALLTVSQAIWHIPHENGRELHLHGWRIVAADSYTILALITLAWIVTRAVIAWRGSRVSPRRG